MLRRLFLLFIIGVLVSCEDEKKTTEGDLTNISYAPTKWSVTLPVKWPKLEVPADNPMTEEGIDLGRHLFYDKLLSADGTQSCASCHRPTGAFTDNLPVSKGIDGIAGKRSAMSLVNIGLVQPISGNKDGIFFWGGRAKTLEQQALEPVEDPIELHNEWPNVIDDLKKSTLYPAKFRKAFGISNKSEITKELAAKAIAQFERSLLSYNSIYDRVEREELSYTDDQLEGLLRYIDDEEVPFSKQMECSHCHPLPLTTSNDFENNALHAAEKLTDFKDLGRGKVTSIMNENGKFRVPTLRNILQSTPYMHDGSLKTIDDVLDHYLTGGHYSPNASPLIRDAATSLKKFTEEDRKYIKAFLETFTDTAFLNNPAIQDPF